MVYCILFAAAFMFFILDRKIRFAVIPGTVVTFLSWCGLVRFAYDTSREMQMDFYSQFANQKTMLYISYVSPAVLIMCFALVSTLALSAIGKNFGRYIFESTGNTDKTGKTAKLLCVISSVVVTAASILYLILYSLIFSRNTAPSVSNAAKRFSYFYGIPSLPRAKMGLYITVFVILLVLSIAYIILISIKRTMIREISPSSGASKAKAICAPLKAGIIIACAGNIFVWIAAIISPWKHIRFFDGTKYGYLSAIGLILNIVGVILLIIGLSKKSSKPSVLSLVISSSLLILTVIDQFLVSVHFIRYLAALFRSLYSFRLLDHLWLSRNAPNLLAGTDTVLFVLLTVGTVITLRIIIASSSKKKI